MKPEEIISQLDQGLVKELEMDGAMGNVWANVRLSDRGYVCVSLHPDENGDLWVEGEIPADHNNPDFLARLSLPARARFSWDNPKENMAYQARAVLKAYEDAGLDYFQDAVAQVG